MRFYTEKQLREEIDKALCEARRKEDLAMRLERIDDEIRELRERIWSLEHPPTMNPREEANK